MSFTPIEFYYAIIDERNNIQICFSAYSLDGKFKQFDLVIDPSLFTDELFVEKFDYEIDKLKNSNFFNKDLILSKFDCKEFAKNILPVVKRNIVNHIVNKSNVFSKITNLFVGKSLLSILEDKEIMRMLT
jgi:hypothetical protein